MARYALRSLFWIPATALWLSGCPAPGGDGTGEGKADSGGEGEDASGEQFDASGSGEDLGAPDAPVTPPADAATPPDAASPADAGTDGPVVSPDMATGECKDGETRGCEGCAAGTQTCAGGAWGPCVGEAEVCNGEDDNCDGQVDETFPALGMPCSQGTGECEAEGVVICGPDGGTVLCGASPGQPNPEICDGLDNDCDGQVDLDANGQPLGEACYSGPAGTEGVGVCRGGSASCDPAAPEAVCQGEVLPSPEVCDGLDNDCNGIVDDAPGGGALITPCYDGEQGTEGVGLCRPGTRRCDGGRIGACEGQILPSDEICDTLDNDCDGLVDNPPDVNGMPQSCDCEPGEVQDCYAGPEGTEGVGICVGGRQTCIEDGSSFGICDGQVLPQAEICDGVDNDCSGEVDDHIEGAGDACSVGVGACAAVGQVVCDAAAFELRCDAAPGQPGEEVCNGVDDNCDGRVDEGFPLGDACLLGEGQCGAQGRLACDAEGGVFCDAEPGVPVDEVCDGLDNDCDGVADNGFPLGEGCQAGVGACTAEGVLVCGADGGTTCSAVPGAPSAELCDGVDNDCDAVIDDEPEDIGALCVADAAGECAAGHIECSEGARVCVSLRGPAPEACDGRDNDCDGVTDESDDGALLSQGCYTGPAGTEDEGVCHGGVSTCRGGEFGPCEGEVVPSEEICDSADNDCDGIVDDLDEGECACEPGAIEPCYTGPAGTENVGACRGGRWTCAADGLSFGACEGQVVPGGETCDATDNDCDGATDESVPGTGVACSAGIGECRAEGQTVCNGQAGQIACNAVPGRPRNEVCDNRDNDCDNQTDEGLGLGTACTNGVGACQRAGVRVCDANGGVTCNAVPAGPTNEVCDNVDNDCDGAVDEGLNLGAVCTVGVGACRRQGVNVCGPNGTVVCNVQAGQPSAEACDNVDNDCDGQTDEGNPGGGGACNTGVPGLCAQGALACTNGALRCQQTVQPANEVCDGRDNDCDGGTDENAAGGPLSQACYGGPAGTQNVGICRGGNQTCANGAYGACVGQVTPAPADICDGLDNNCNGTVDEQPVGQMCACLPGSTRNCYSGPAGTQNVGVCRGGTQTCNQDGMAWGACQGETLPSAEVCDNLDNDCNGTRDDAPGVGQACSVGTGDCRAAGVNRCNVQTRQVECSATAGNPSPEVCDGRDNNCNGTTDDVAGLGEACTNGTGACQRAGNRVCDLARGQLVCNAVPGQPGAETCDGVDNDCDATVDDPPMPGIGDRCVAGVGECLAAGVTVCNGAQGPACGAQPGQPQPERCDARDNDCDGTVDDNPTDVGQACTVGVGACQRQGATLCNGGQLSCSAQAGAPSRELCDGTDNDCDGQTDEGLDCNVYKSCLDAYVRGARANGIFRVQPTANEPVSNVFCDHTTDQGGWTLVGSSSRSVMDDAAAAWYADLLTLAPSQANPGVWSGLRSLGTRFDVRFACRPNLGQEGDRMTVDLSFYRTPWYSEFTTGNDAASCFSENGTQDFPVIARRNNLTGEMRFRGDQYGAGAFVGEDACASGDDFAVDFDDRGMDSNQGDGTDWGEDDGVLKCGNTGLATGQWFVFARERGRVAVVGVPVTAQILEDGFRAQDLPIASVPGNLTAETYEAVLIGRYSFNWPAVTDAVKDALRVFTDNGGDVVTEYDGAGIFGSGFDANYGYANGAPAAMGLWRYSVNGGSNLANNTPLDIVDNADPVVAGLPDPFSAQGGTEFFVTLQPVPRLQTRLTTVATFAGNGSAQFPQGNHPAIARGRRCSGNYLTANFDWSDNRADPNIRILLRNLISEALRPSLAATEDVCGDRVRTNLMLCGNSTRNLSTFVRGGRSFPVVNGCVPDANTQALFVTRTGAGQVNAQALQTYLAGGGIVITEYSASDEVFNAAFGTAVVEGAQSGSCGDNVMPAVQFGALDSLWDDNRFVPIAANRTGCGKNLAAFPGITPLGGPGGAAVTLAYRDYQGRGRVWLVESDWQDNQNNGADMTADSLGLMHYMIFHGAGNQLSFAGPQLNWYLPEVQRGGFTICHQSAYNSSVPLATISAACDGAVLMMACRPTGSNTLQLVAMGNRADVFFDVGAGANAVHNANGVDWYYSTARSWGFAPPGLGVNRNTCDTLDTSPGSRLCWHTNNNNMTSGYRCGANLGLFDATYERIVLERTGGL